MRICDASRRHAQRQPGPEPSDTVAIMREPATVYGRCRVCRAQMNRLELPRLKQLGHCRWPRPWPTFAPHGCGYYERTSESERHWECGGPDGVCACACAQLEAAGCRLALAYALLGAPADTTRFGLVADVVATHGDANTAFAPIFSRFMVNVLL